MMSGNALVFVAAFSEPLIVHGQLENALGSHPSRNGGSERKSPYQTGALKWLLPLMGGDWKR
jgi:hypothetical protein